jgi:hypothetical protein
MNLAVAAAVDERREPADLHLASNHDEQIGPAHLENKTRFRIDEMRILTALREPDDRDPVTTDLACKRRQVLGRCDNANRCRRECDAQREHHHGQ